MKQNKSKNKILSIKRNKKYCVEIACQHYSIGLAFSCRALKIHNMIVYHFKKSVRHCMSNKSNRSYNISGSIRNILLRQTDDYQKHMGTFVTVTPSYFLNSPKLHELNFLISWK